MARARGANAVLAGAFESTYGVVPGSGFFQLPFVSSEIGETQNLLPSNLLGLGRDPQSPTLDVADDTGNMVIPVDLRHFGFWLKALCGAAQTDTQGLAATGSYLSDGTLPANNSKVTVNGTDVTFVSATPSGSQVKIGATVAATLASLVIFLNQSVDANISPATYALALDNLTVNVTHKTIGTAGNSFTIVASSSPASHLTASGATLAGGAASGPYNHVFYPGGLTVPSLTLEPGFPDVPSYGANFGAVLDSLEIQMQRSGLLNATLALIAQGETRAASSIAGSPTTRVIERFSQFTGQVIRDGVPLANVVSGSVKVGNGLDKVDVIRADGRIAGADPGTLDISGQVVTRFADTALLDLAVNNTPVDLVFGWSIAAGKSLKFEAHKVLLPKPKLPVTGPAGIQATFPWLGSKHDTLLRSMTITLVNDVASY